MKALSIRQPWAWLILRPDLTTPSAREGARCFSGIKPVENRTWETMYRGELLIHASQTVTRDDYEACKLFLLSDERTAHVAMDLPAREALQVGGIVGRVQLVACTRAHESPYFCGPFGWVFDDPQPLPFKPLKGRLGLFNVNAMEVLS
ncbi:MAG: hypothetical protein F9K35_13300 [Burkholderiaceae bacterium]|nr:MAG: hypothetical protein F9K35_13300 [Burkholderiaceae bacterium]